MSPSFANALPSPSAHRSRRATAAARPVRCRTGRCKQGREWLLSGPPNAGAALVRVSPAAAPGRHRLAGGERRVAAAQGQQLVVRPVSTIRRRRARRSGRRRERSRAGARSRSSCAPRRGRERLLHGPLGLGVERRGRLVEHEDRRVAQDRARDRSPLLLAAREAVAALADDRVVALGQRRDQPWICAARAACSISSSVASGFAKRRLSRTVAWKRYVSCETTPTVAASDGERQVADVDAVDRHGPFVTS